MKIKIVSNSCGPQAWYANRIGEEFEARPYHFGFNTGDWMVGKVDGTGEDCLVAAEDAEEMEELVLKQKFKPSRK